MFKKYYKMYQIEYKIIFEDNELHRTIFKYALNKIHAFYIADRTLYESERNHRILNNSIYPYYKIVNVKKYWSNFI